MAKYLIVYDAGYGEIASTFEACSQEEADLEAWALWKDAVETEASYRAEPLTEELAEDYELDWEEDK